MESFKTTILVVDDEAAIRRIALERAGFAVIDARDGEQALEIFLAEGLGIQLLLSDVVMPKLDGLKLADRVLATRPELPVLFISGDNTDATRDFGCLPSLSRPVSWSGEFARSFSSLESVKLIAWNGTTSSS